VALDIASVLVICRNKLTGVREGSTIPCETNRIEGPRPCEGVNQGPRTKVSSDNHAMTVFFLQEEAVHAKSALEIVQTMAKKTPNSGKGNDDGAGL
jgi:hypothetical protein